MPLASCRRQTPSRHSPVEEVWSTDTKFKWQWVTEAPSTCSRFSTHRGLVCQWCTEMFSTFVCEKEQNFGCIYQVYKCTDTDFVLMHPYIMFYDLTLYDSKQQRSLRWSESWLQWTQWQPPTGQKSRRLYRRQQKEFTLTFFAASVKNLFGQWATQIPRAVTVVLWPSRPSGVWECCGGVGGCCQWRLRLDVVNWSFWKIKLALEIIFFFAKEKKTTPKFYFTFILQSCNDVIVVDMWWQNNIN